MKKIIATFLAVTVFSSVLPANTGVSSVAADSITDQVVTAGSTLPVPDHMRVELMEEAYGIDTLTPTFSWSMNQNDGEKNIKQESYRMLITNAAGTTIVDSGWTQSGKSAYISPVGIAGALAWNSLYYWQVQVKDNAGRVSALSGKKAFTTAMDNGWPQNNPAASGWADITGIWHDPAGAPAQNVWEKAGWTDYTIEMDLYVDACIGIVFREQSGGWYYMWQVKSNGPTVTSNPNSIVPHINGSNAGAVSMAAYGISITPSTLTSVKIELNGSAITTYVKDSSQAWIQVDRRTNAARNYGYIGFRTGGAEEGGTVDSIKVTKTGTGQVLYEDDFSANRGAWDLSVSNGRLVVPKGKTGGTHISGSILNSEEDVPEKGDYMFARHAFHLSAARLAQIDKAVVSFAAKSPAPSRQYVGNLYMNGKFVGLDISHFGKTVTQGGILWYTNFDVTNLLLQGENVIGAINYTTSEKQFLVQMTVHYKDGTSEALVNSGRDYQQWKTLDGTAVYGQGHSIGTSYFTAAAEYINANKFPFGWNEPGFDDTGWRTPKLGSAMVENSQFRPFDSETTKRWYTGDEPDVYKTTVTKNSSGNYVVDLGREIVGGVRLRVNLSGMASKTITMRMGEEMTGDSVRYQMRTGNTYYQNWTLKPGEQALENIGMMAFRYIEILDWPSEAGELTAANIDGVAMYQKFDESKSDFTSSSDLLTKIYDTMKYAIKVTNQDLMVDSQSRERGAYEGDIMINMMSSYSFSDNYSLARHSFEKTNTDRTWPLEYAMFAILMAYHDYMYTGNKDSMAEFYDLFEERFTRTYTHGRQGVAFNSLLTDMGDGTLLMHQAKAANDTNDSTIVDWPTTEQDGYAYSASYYNAVGNAVCYAAYEYMGVIAEILGKADTVVAGYKDKAARLKAGFIKYFYDDTAGAVRDGLSDSRQPANHYAQHATAYALCYGLYPDFDAAGKMVSYIASQGQIRMSVYGSFFLLSGLYNTDVASAGDTAYQLLTSTGLRSWNNMIGSMGATITAEAWDTSLKPNMTFSHPWGSAPGSQIIQGLFGIEPLEPAFDKFQYKFQIGDLKYAGIKTPSLKGSIEASFDTRGEHPFQAAVSIPANTTARVMIPDMGYANMDSLLIDGRAVAAQQDGNYLVVELGSGEYTIALNVVGSLAASLDENVTYVGQTGQVEVDYVGANSTVERATYRSSNPSVVSVDASGRVAIAGTGQAAITVTADVRMLDLGKVYTVSATVNVTGKEPVYDDFYIRLSGDLYRGKTAKATVIGILENGCELAVDDADIQFSSLDEAVFTADAAGNLTGVRRGETAVLKAVLAKIPRLSGDFDISRIAYGEVYHSNDFSTATHGLSMFGGNVSVSDGVLEVSGGARGWYNGAGAAAWTDYTFKSDFKIVNTAASFTFRHTNSTDFYLWQIKNDNGTYLKKHVFQTGRANGYSDLGSIPFDSGLLKTDGWNQIAIRVDGNTFSTYLNGTLIDVTTESSLPVGSIGVRTGASESFQIDRWSVEEHLLSMDKEVTVYEFLVTDALEFLVQKAETLKAEGALIDVMPAVVTEFEAALKAARDVLADTSAVQEDIDHAERRLLTALTMLDWKIADKTDLAQAIALAEHVTSEIDKYVAAGKTELAAALATARTLYADENAFQDAVDQSFLELMEAVTNMRKKANKEDLAKLIAEAGTRDLRLYTADSVAAFNAALADAQAILANDALSEADQEQVDLAVKALRAAMNGLRPLTNDGDDTDTDPDGGTDTGGGADTDNGGAAGGETGSETTGGDTGIDNPKTGSDSPAAAAMVLIFAGCGLLASAARKRRSVRKDK